MDGYYNFFLVSYLWGKDTIEHVERRGNEEETRKERTITHAEDRGFVPVEGIFDDC